MLKNGKKDNLTYKVFETRAEMGEYAAAEAAKEIAAQIGRKGTINMIFAAAPSQNEFLAALISHSEIDWSRINAFHMDEYIGLDPLAPQGFGNFLKNAIFGKVPFASVNYINCAASDPYSESDRYAALLKEHPCDIICMGIGENGHIAFNDPAVADFHDKKAVKPVTLDNICRQQQVNDGCFASIDQVPLQALTLTIPTLIAPDSVFCIVPAATKAKAVYNTINGDISESCPASILRTHKNAVLYLDKDSASLLG